MMIQTLVAATMLCCTLARAQSVCAANRPAYGDIGVGLFQCVRANCMIAGRNHDDSSHVFNVEPTMWYIAESARRQLEDGDALVAIDGIPITTRAGGVRLALLRPGTRTNLLVRRGSRELSVTITAVSSCERPSIQITSSSGGPPAEVSRLALQGINIPAQSGQSQRDRHLDVLGIKASSVIDSIAPGSAAAGLGLRAGDVIVSIEELPRAGTTVVLSARVTYRRNGVLNEAMVTVNAPKR
jgi:hypothetical protein